MVHYIYRMSSEQKDCTIKLEKTKRTKTGDTLASLGQHKQVNKLLYSAHWNYLSEVIEPKLVESQTF